MNKKRRQAFLEAVAAAARNTTPPVPRGRPVADNLTEEGRVRGLVAMRAAPRCRASCKDGRACKAAALRGATRCVKHGGRVEVPSHSHNIRRFFAGAMERVGTDSVGEQSDQDFWDGLPPSIQREVAGLVSKHTLQRPAKLYFAARVWLEVRNSGFPAIKRFLDQFARA